MTKEQLLTKRIYFILIIAYFVIGYFICGYFNLHRSYYFDVSLPFEKDIPFVPFFIIGYTSVYVCLFLLYLIIDDFAYFRKAMIFFLAVSTVHCIIFLLVPVKMIRPDLTEATGIMNTLTNYYYWIDSPVNCFPSLHVSYPFAGTLILWNYKRAWGYVLALFTLFIAISVVLVKQHYIMDVVGAIFVTSILFLILKRCTKLENERSLS